MRGRYSKKPDFWIFFSVFALLIFGLVMLSSASSSLGKSQFNDSYFYLKHQIYYGLSVGILGFIAGFFIYYRRWEKLAVPILLATVGLLLLVFTSLGYRAHGADRWLDLGVFSFQPSEILKISFIIYLAAWLSRKSHFIPFLIMIAIIGGVLIKQPATSTAAILIGASLVTYFMSGARFYQIFLVSLLGAAAFVLVIYFTPYRWERVKTFFDQGADREAAGFHLNQTRIAIGSGGLLGVGYGGSTIKTAYLPEPIGDSIFAVIAEELGFLGAAALIGLILLLVIRILLVAKNCHDRFGYLLLVGFAAVIAIQSFVNIAAISGVIPLTGTPLPYISYGGTSLAVYLTIAGIILNVSRYS